MRRQWVVNAALVVLALGTLVAVWLTRNSATTSALESRKEKLLATWDKDAVTRLVLRRGDRELELVQDARLPGGFRIAKPWKEPADPATVSSLLGSLELASAVRPAPGVATAEAGLGAPSLELRIEMAGTQHVIKLGSAAPAPRGARYAAVTSAGQAEQRYVISRGLVEELDVPFDKFREQRLLEYGRSELAKIEISAPAGHSTLEQKSPGVFYRQVGGSAELTNPETTERILAALSRLASEELVEPDQARAGLGADAVRVRLELEQAGQAPISMSLGGQCGTRSGMVFALRERAGQSARAGCVPRELSEALDVSPETLALTRPFSARVDEVEELRIARGGAKLELARKGSAFALRAPSPSEIPLDAGNQRLLAILGAEGRIVPGPDLAALGLEPAAGDIVIQTSSADRVASRTQRVVLGKPRADGASCLKRELDGVVLCFEAEAARAFEPDATLLRSLDLSSFAASDVASVYVKTSKLEQRVRRSSDGSFALEKPAGFRHDGALVTDLVQTLGALRAERWVSLRAEASHGLLAPRTHIEIELSEAEPTKSRVLAIGAATRDGFFASLSPDPGVFVLARATVLELERLLLDRSLCPVTSAELQRIELSAPPRQLTLTRTGDTWQSPALSAQRAGELGEALSALRAEAALHVGPATPDEGFAQPSLLVTFVGKSGTAQRLRLGARATLAGQGVVFARLEGVDATFALSASTASALQGF